MMKLTGLILLNLALAIFNAWSVGRSWNESRAAGGLARLTAWSGAIMSASGFTWCYVIMGALALQAGGKLRPLYVQGMLSAGYLLVVMPVIVSGLVLTLQSWAHFWRRRNIFNGGVATYNTFAQVYNTTEAFSAIPDAVSDVLRMFRSDDSDDDGLGYLALALVVCAGLAGILSTAAIIRVTARNQAARVVDHARTSWGPGRFARPRGSYGRT